MANDILIFTIGIMLMQISAGVKTKFKPKEFFSPGIFGDVSLLATVVIMSFAMPAATCTVIFAQQYKTDARFAAKGVLMSTLLCLITIPVFALLLG